MRGRDEKARIAGDLGGKAGDPGTGGAREGDVDNVITRDASAQRYAAEQWRRENPDAWRYIVRIALNEAAHDRKFSMQYLIEEVRRKSLVTTEGKPFGVNNTMRPALTRLLVEEHPEVRPYVETRHAACDWAFQEP